MTNNPQTPSEIPSWNLRDMFQSIQDPEIETIFTNARQQSLEFSEKYKGKLNELSPAEIQKVLQEYEALIEYTAKPELYAYLLFAADSSKPEHGVFLQKAKTQSTEMSENLIFFDLELTNLPKENLDILLNAPELTNYKHYIEKLVAWKPHRLSESEERIFNDKALTSSSAFERFFEEELSQKEFEIKLKGKKQKLNETEILDLLYSPKTDIRKTASEAFTAGLKDLSRRTTFIYNTLLQDKQIGDKYSKFNIPEEPRHLSNETNAKAVQALTEAVVESFSIVHEYYEIKKRILGVNELFDYDRYAPINTKEKPVSYSQAKEFVLTAFENFSPSYASYAKQFFEGNWIDAEVRPGKRGGAFCMGCTPKLHPYVLINFTGKMKEVRTLAHELGHGVHDMCMRKQTVINYGTPLTSAETSSIFAEMLLFDNLRKQKLSKEQRIALYCGKIEEIFASVHRQISMFRFEQQAHAKRRTEGELTTEQYNEIWRNTQTEMFGSSVTLTPNYDIWWSYVTHFFESPFYVYAYAFGELLTLSLYAMYQQSEDKKGFAQNYMDNVLGAGTTKSPQDILTPFGINLDDKAFWQKGISEIREILEELKKLV